MINPNWRQGTDAITLSVGGQKIGALQSLFIEPDHTEKVEREILEMFPTFEGTVTLENVEFGSKTLLHMMNPSFDVVVRTGNYMPPRKLRSKKRRLRKKWEKMYTYDVEEMLYKNCTITGVSE